MSQERSAEPSAEDRARWHRRFAADCSNRAWQLADQASPRTAAEDDEMPHAAARAAGDAIEDGEDRAIFEATFARIPRP